jgi:hypothetical protein
MIITILAEPRSGSTNLARWFGLQKDFTIFMEPLNPNMAAYGEYKKEISPKLWEYKTPHLLVKEIFRPETDFFELIEISDKVIILYRENISEQTESWLNANKTNNWDKAWVFKENLIKDEDAWYFNELKKGIKENYLDKNYFNISYEELYYNNGFQKILDYLNIDELENKNFPHGQKYRINVDKRKNLI